MRILIVGVGGVGAAFGVPLVESGLDVTFFARGEHARAVRKSGLVLSGFKKRRLPIRIASGRITKPFDLVVLTVKCQDLENVLSQIGEAISRKTTILTLQNGVDAEQIVRKRVSHRQIVAGVAYVDARIVSPAHVYIAKPGRIVIGTLTQSAEPNLKEVLKVFEKAGVEIRSTEDVLKTKWNKLCWNAVFNPICALTRLTAGQVQKRPELEHLAKKLVEEIRSVARREGVKIDAGMAKRFFSPQDGQSSGNMDTRTSMWTDFERGRPTEIEFLNGAISRRGRKQGVETPVNDTIVALIKALERSRD